MLQVKTLTRLPFAIKAFAMLLAPSLPAWADGDDQERARQAMLAGEVRPLTDLLFQVESMYEGEVIEVELEEDESGAWSGADGKPILLYEIKLLTPQGNLVKLEFDAKSLELLTVDGHDSESARKDLNEEDD